MPGMKPNQLASIIHKGRVHAMVRMTGLQETARGGEKLQEFVLAYLGKVWHAPYTNVCTVPSIGIGNMICGHGGANIEAASTAFTLE
jgi:hypothetical protein